MEEKGGFTDRRRRYSDEFKARILEESRDTGVSLSVLARKNGIHPITVYQWKRMRSMDDSQDVSSKHIKDLFLEIEQLKKENKTLKVKVADLSITNEILETAIEISKKRELLKKAESQEKLKNLKNSK